MREIILSRSNSDLVLCVAQARRQLARAETLTKVKSIRDKAEAVRAYARAHGDAKEAERSASLVVLWSERRMGEILERTGQRGRPTKEKGPDSGPLLKDMGVTKQRAYDFRRFAAMPEDEFREFAERELCHDGVLKALRKRAAEELERAALKSAPPFGWSVTDDQAVVSCEALVTDPPYGVLDEPWEPDDLERFTRDWASRWNGCGADLVAVFFSQRHLWDGRLWFDESFSDYSFQQLLVWHYPNNKSPQDRMGFKRTWEPIFLYRRKGATRRIVPAGSEWGDGLNDSDCHVAAVPQSNFADAERKVHPAQKPVSVFRWLINAMTVRGELVADPFAGSGTCGIAARQLGRGFHGIETDAAYAGKARERIAAYGSV